MAVSFHTKYIKLTQLNPSKYLVKLTLRSLKPNVANTDLQNGCSYARHWIFQDTVNHPSYLYVDCLTKHLNVLSFPYFTSTSSQETAHTQSTSHSRNSIAAQCLTLPESTPHSAEDQRKCLGSLRPSLSALSSLVFSVLSHLVNHCLFTGIYLGFAKLSKPSYYSSLQHLPASTSLSICLQFLTSSSSHLSHQQCLDGLRERRNSITNVVWSEA